MFWLLNVCIHHRVTRGGSGDGKGHGLISQVIGLSKTQVKWSCISCCQRTSGARIYSTQLTWLVSCHCVTFSSFVSQKSPLSLYTEGCYIGMGHFGRGTQKGRLYIELVTGQLLRKNTLQVL